MALHHYPWKSRALNLFAPHPEDVDVFCDFVRQVAVRDHLDTIVLIVRYNYAFISHPECRGDHPLSRQDVQRITAVCRENGIRIIPNMNLLGHQTVQDTVKPDGLLRAHPEFSETPLVVDPEHSYSLCPRHPEVLPLMLDLVDELVDAFECDMFHIGMDEVFCIGMCDRCKDTDPGILFADWVNALADHLLARGVTPMMWGDRLLNSTELGYGPWDASQSTTWKALEHIRKEIIITDWHYHNWPHFPSPEIFARAGHKVYLCPFNIAQNAKLFLDYAAEHDAGNILGVMETTWVPFRFLADGMAGKEVPDFRWYKDGLPNIIACYNWLFRGTPMPPPPED